MQYVVEDGTVTAALWRVMSMAKATSTHISPFRAVRAVNESLGLLLTRCLLELSIKKRGKRGGERGERKGGKKREGERKRERKKA
jgi:hypothetical protein